MKIYKASKLFNSRTGEEIEPDYKACGVICDYTGESMDEDDLQNYPQYDIKISYYSGMEQAYYYDDGKEYFEKLGISYDSIFENSEYHFAANGCFGPEFRDNSQMLVADWMAGISNEASLYYNCPTVENAFRIMRVNLIKRLLAEKKYTKEELGLN